MAGVRWRWGRVRDRLRSGWPGGQSEEDRDADLHPGHLSIFLARPELSVLYARQRRLLQGRGGGLGSGGDRLALLVDHRIDEDRALDAGKLGDARVVDLTQPDDLRELQDLPRRAELIEGGPHRDLRQSRIGSRGPVLLGQARDGRFLHPDPLLGGSAVGPQRGQLRGVRAPRRSRLLHRFLRLGEAGAGGVELQLMMGQLAFRSTGLAEHPVLPFHERREPTFATCLARSLAEEPRACQGQHQHSRHSRPSQDRGPARRRRSRPSRGLGLARQDQGLPQLPPAKRAPRRPQPGPGHGGLRPAAGQRSSEGFEG